MPVPTDRQYSKEHEWALPESNGTIRVGISDFAQHELGDVIYVELPKTGDHVTQGEQMGEIESVKAVSELFSPVTGEVIEINADVNTNPELVNDDPYTRGWLVLIKPDDAGALTGLLDASAYESLTT